MSWLKPKEAAKEMNISLSSMMRLIYSGEFPAVLISQGRRKKTYRIREEIILRWAMGRENGKGPYGRKHRSNL